MNQITFESSQWYDAATLSERVSGFQARGERPGNLTLDVDSSPRRLGRWMTQQPFHSDSFLKDRLARDIGDRLDSIALRGEREASWIGLTLNHQHKWTLSPLDLDLYDGLPGVALFLVHLGAITGQERYTALARSALSALQSKDGVTRGTIASIGGFSGVGGLIYAYAQLSRLWNESGLLRDAENLLDLLPELIEQDDCYDIIVGAAGCIGGLLTLYRCAPSERILRLARQCGDHLIERSQPIGSGIGPGIGWKQQWAENRPLTGFSHGAAGVAWALFELASILPAIEKYRAAALKALAYERSLFSPDEANWPDLREGKGSGAEGKATRQKFRAAWCHGAPGIGLARLSSLAHCDDAETRAEISAALSTTLAKGFGGNHSLCHGDLGNIELLLYSSLVLDDPEMRTHVGTIASAILESIERDGWLCGVPLGAEPPGLMTGIAGIGYELLRLAHPNRVPSILVLEPPAFTDEV